MTTKHLRHYIQERKKLWNTKQDLELDLQFREAMAQQIKVDPDLLIQLKYNPELIIPLMFIIVDKDGNVVPFFFNRVQEHILERINLAKAQYAAGTRNSMKFRCLKGRQQGVTALITAYQLAHVLFKPNFAGFTIADVAENARVILNDKAKYPYNHLPQILKPREKFNSTSELFFDGLNSSWRVSSAESGEAGRSRTIHFLHASECAFWSNYSKLIAAIKPAIVKGSIIFEETTANGHNDFHANWFDTNSDYENIFVEWWDSDEYILRFESPEIQTKFKKDVNASITPLHQKMKILREEKKLTWGQLYWYFTEGKTLKAKLPQEYPCTAEEAFLFSGMQFFDVNAISDYILKCKNIEPLEVLHNGQIVIYEHPIEGEDYYIGADPAEGLPTGDFSHAKIFKSSTCEEVAFIHGHFAPDPFGKLLVKYAKYYNNAFIGVESNNHGHAVLNTIWIYEKYKKVYQQYQVNRRIDKPERGRKIGWLTNEHTKFIMLDELDTALMNGIIFIKDIDFYKQAITVVYEESSTTNKNAPLKVHLTGRDRVAAAAIAYQMRKYHKKRNAMFEHIKRKAANGTTGTSLPENKIIKPVERPNLITFPGRHIG